MDAYKIREWIETEANANQVAVIMASCFARVAADGRPQAEDCEEELMKLDTKDQSEAFEWMADWVQNWKDSE